MLDAIIGCAHRVFLPEFVYGCFPVISHIHSINLATGFEMSKPETGQPTDALSPLGIDINELPATPERLFRLIAAARAKIKP